MHIRYPRIPRSAIQYPVERVVPWSSERRAALALATKSAGALRFITHKLRLKLRAEMLQTVVRFTALPRM